jgi:hypothetical protein
MSNATLRPIQQPKIRNLRDLTGEGYAGQFVLFEYEFCGNALTSVLGYSQVYDQAVQYQVEVLGGKARLVSTLGLQSFSEDNR